MANFGLNQVQPQVGQPQQCDQCSLFAKKRRMQPRNLFEVPLPKVSDADVGEIINKLPSHVVTDIFKHLPVKQLHGLELLNKQMKYIVDGAFLKKEKLVVDNFNPDIDWKQEQNRDKLLSLMLRCGRKLRYVEFRKAYLAMASGDITMEALQAKAGSAELAKKCPNIEAFGSVYLNGSEELGNVLCYAICVNSMHQECKIERGIQFFGRESAQTLSQFLNLLPHLKVFNTTSSKHLAGYVLSTNQNLRELTISMSFSSIKTQDIHDLATILNNSPKLRTLELYLEAPFVDPKAARSAFQTIHPGPKLSIFLYSCVAKADMFGDEMAKATLDLSCSPFQTYNETFSILRFSNIHTIDMNDGHLMRVVFENIDTFEQLHTIRFLEFADFAEHEQTLISLFQKRKYNSITKLFMWAPLKMHKSFLRAVAANFERLDTLSLDIRLDDMDIAQQMSLVDLVQVTQLPYMYRIEMHIRSSILQKNYEERLRTILREAQMQEDIRCNLIVAFEPAGMEDSDSDTDSAISENEE